MKERIMVGLVVALLANRAPAQMGQHPVSPAEGGARSGPLQVPTGNTTSDLEHDFFAALRAGNVRAFLGYVPADGVNVGKDTLHLTRSDVEDQMRDRGTLYCKLFDSSCIKSEIKLDASNVRACSYRELLTKSQKVRTAATETTRNGTRQAILVAEIKNKDCAGLGLIDFIFNYNQGAWKLFSIP